MKKNAVIVFMLVTLLSLGMTVYGWNFVEGQIGEVILTEETITGNRSAAQGLTVGFCADSADSLHWTCSYDYRAEQTTSAFERGEVTRKEEHPIYDDMRFNGWSTAPYYTQLKDLALEGLLDKKIQHFYNDIQMQVYGKELEKKGKIRLADYLDNYPVSFDFQFGTKRYNSENALMGLKVHEKLGKNTNAYDEDIEMYRVFNQQFRIPVIDNEYQKYKVLGVEKFDREKELGCKTDMEKPMGKGEDYYEFDPLIALQEENIKDGKTWVHPDLSADGGYTSEDEADDSYVGRLASEYNLKNRIFLVVNNRTVKGTPVDVSQIHDGYGVYELPFVVVATTTITNNPKSRTVVNPQPQLDKIKMVYPLDKDAEYVELSLSGDHRYLAVFSVKNGDCYVDMVDADTWASQGLMKVFSASKKMTYAWSGDGSLALSNNKGSIAVLSRTENQDKPYEILYCGKVGEDFCRAFFDGKTTEKINSNARYKCGVERGLVVTVKDGKAALVQNLLAGDGNVGIRNPGLECAVIDRTGILYRGRLKTNITDLEEEMSGKEVQQVRKLYDGTMIKPAGSENRAEWKTLAKTK